jgi:hypothetical protein
MPCWHWQIQSDEHQVDINRACYILWFRRINHNMAIPTTMHSAYNKYYRWERNSATRMCGPHYPSPQHQLPHTHGTFFGETYTKISHHFWGLHPAQDGSDGACTYPCNPHSYSWYKLLGTISELPVRHNSETWISIIKLVILLLCCSLWQIIIYTGYLHCCLHVNDNS